MTEIYLHIVARMHGRLIVHAPVYIVGVTAADQVQREVSGSGSGIVAEDTVEENNGVLRKITELLKKLRKKARLALADPRGTMRVGLIGHFKPCTTDIYLHI